MEKILKDDLIKVLKMDSTSSTFVSERIIEIFKTVITYDNEKLLDDLRRRCTHLEKENSKI